MTNVIDRIKSLSSIPAEEEAFESWLQQEDSIAFLEENLNDSEIVVYASLSHVFVHGIFVPTTSLDPLDQEDLMSWNAAPDATWGACYSFSDLPEVSISHPLESCGSETLSEGEKLIFYRTFEGRVGNKHYIEVLQKFAHFSDLHFLSERNAYCRLDSRGDIEEVIRVIDANDPKSGLDGTLVTISRPDLDKYMAVSDVALVRTFDFARFRVGNFGGWKQSTEPDFTVSDDLFYRSTVERGNASYARGCQIVRPGLTKQDVVKDFEGHRRDEDHYVSFIAQDWKNGVIDQISCGPGKTANYFTESDLPFELSPAFFRPEVLTKYKADSEKYRLEHRSISCRGAWYLKSYDINDAGQVHTYLVYLRDLPYEEQLYWKSYNEKPKGTISDRAIKTDFEGSWDLEYEPLSSLIEALRDLQNMRVPWWRLGEESQFEKVHYPVTESVDEWANEILLLDQLLVEGFRKKWLRRKASELGLVLDSKLGSLKLTEAILAAVGIEEIQANEIMTPLYIVRDLRTKLKGHTPGRDARRARIEALKKHRSLKEHFRVLCEDCDEAFRTISDAFSNFSD